MSARLSGQQIHFLSLQTAIFCVQCELLSANNTPSCLACGSKAVLSLSRLFGGCLRSQPTARLIEDDELNRLVRELLFTVPGTEAEHETSSLSTRLPARHHARTLPAEAQPSHGSHFPQISLEPAIGVITERSQMLTRATGAAIALRNGNEIICRARAGRTAPDLGVRLQTDSGISAQCLRRGEVVLCNDAKTIPWLTRGAAAGLVCALSLLLRCASSRRRWESSKCSPPPLTPLIVTMWLLCSSFPA